MLAHDPVRDGEPEAGPPLLDAGREVLIEHAVEDVLLDPAYDRRTQADLLRVTGYRTFLGVPILRDGRPIGVLGCARRAVDPFAPVQIALVETFAEQAAMAIENVRLFAELEARNRALAESLEQQTATGEILQVISRSPTDVQPVFDTIARSAAQLCEAEFCFVFQFDGEMIHLVAHHGVAGEGLDLLRQAWPLPPTRGTVAGRAVLARGVAQIPDVHADPDDTATCLSAIIRPSPSTKANEMLRFPGSRCSSEPFT